MNSVDYTPVLLAQLTDLQMRVTKQDNTIAALKAEVERLTGRTITINDATTMRTSVPLRPKPQGRNDSGDRHERRNDGGDRHERRNDGGDRRERRNDGGDNRDKRHKVASSNPHTVMSLSDVLTAGEHVTIQVGTGKDSEGHFTNTTASATFDGTDLTVTDCELVSSLVGMKSSKPGEILYKFIDALKESGHIKKTFSIAPWKLCFVERNGVRQSLEELRTVMG